MQSLPSKKFLDQLPGWYDDFHRSGAFVGQTFRRYLSDLKVLTGGRPGLRFLDFGCGPHGGLTQVIPDAVGYDPYVPAFAEVPWGRPYDVIFTADVLEHLFLVDLLRFTKNVARTGPQYVLVAVSTRAAGKTFVNGANVHLTIEPASWWQGFLQGRLVDYELVLAEEDLREGAAVFGFCRAGSAPPPPPEVSCESPA